MSRGKTCSYDAHRLSTVTDTSRIFKVIKNGQVEESGNHKDLAASNGLYHRMWKDYCTNVGTFGPESAARLHSDRGICRIQMRIHGKFRFWTCNAWTVTIYQTAASWKAGENK